MSTLAQAAAQAAPVTQPAGSNDPAAVVTLSVVVALSALAIWVACRWLRVYRPSAVAGPERLEPTHSVGPLVAAAGGAVAALFIASIGYGIVMSAARMTMAPASRPADGAVPSASDLIVLSAVSPVFSLVAGVGLLMLVQPGTLRSIGFGWQGLPQGARLGAVAAALVIPVTFLAGSVTEMVYQWTGYEHPAEHDLLKAMNSTPPLLQAMGVVAAVLVAPVVEEFVFRGLVQTSITEWLVRLGRPRPEAPPPPPLGFDVAGVPPLADWAPQSAGIAADSAAASTVSVAVNQYLASSPAGATLPLGYETPPPPTPQDVARKRYPRAWAAILVTSVLFGLVHPLWTFPIIFLLAVCLGYSYERTGSLWTSIALHALFNATSTAFYLAGGHG